MQPSKQSSGKKESSDEKGSLLLIQAPYFEDYGPMRQAAGTYFPFGIGYLSSYVKAHGFDCTFMDPNVQEIYIKDMVQVVRDQQPILVGISFMTPQFFAAKDIVDAIKAAVPEVPVVLGGAHPSVMPSKTLEEIPNADYVVYGEGEETLLELMQHIASNEGTPATIAGLAFRSKHGILVNPTRDLIKDLDALPLPDRDLIDQSLYHQQSFLSYYEKPQTIYTSRGCPSKCTYCASGERLRAKVRVRSIPNLMQEIDLLREKYDIDYLLIKDDTFTLNKRRMRDFSAALKARHPNLKWHCMVRVEKVDYNTLAIMKDAGLSNVFFGIESGDDDILQEAGRGRLVTTTVTRKIVEYAEQLGIRTYGAFILGLPGETPETIEKTIKYACSLPLTMAGFSVLIPYPGTRVFTDYYPVKEGEAIDYRAFIASTGVHYVPEYTGLQGGLRPQDLPDYVSKAQWRFYMRPQQIVRMLKQSTPALMIGYMKGVYALIAKFFYLKKLQLAQRSTQ